MIGIVKEVSGQKTIVPLTTDIGTGAPVGTLISQYKKVSMSGYLYCDGSTFDETVYPALYLYLGTNVLPDYRECVMVGAEENTTDTIAEHDVYTQGEFKDDQLQTHTHGANNPYPSPTGTYDFQSGNIYGFNVNSTTRNVSNARSGTTTHGKQKAVFVYIKATSGLAENQQENVLNDVKDYVDNSNSYSTEETLTGGTWIDGKPIYRKVIECGTLPNNSVKLIPTDVSNIGFVISLKGSAYTDTWGYDVYLALPHVSVDSNDLVQITYEDGNLRFLTAGNRSMYTVSYVTIEYTKTTD